MRRLGDTIRHLLLLSGPGATIEVTKHCRCAPRPRVAARVLARTLPKRSGALNAWCAGLAATLAFRAAVAAAASGGSCSVPFEDVEGAIVVQGRLVAAPGAGDADGHSRAGSTAKDTTGVFILDTGAGYLVLDHGLAPLLAMLIPAT